MFEINTVLRRKQICLEKLFYYFKLLLLLFSCSITRFTFENETILNPKINVGIFFLQNKSPFFL